MKQLLTILTLCIFLLAGNSIAQASCCQTAGDANGDGNVNILDITYLIAFLYQEGPAPGCIDEGDANNDGNINILDITYLIAFLYQQGPAPTCPSTGTVFTDDYDEGVTYEAFDGSLLTAVQLTTENVYAGTQGLEVTIPGSDPWWSGGAFVDTATAKSNRDLSMYNALTFWAKASTAATLDVVGIGNDNSGNSQYIAEVTGLSLTTEWQQFVIPIPLPEKLTAEDGLFHFAEGEGIDYTIWIDEISYDSLTTISNIRPSITTQTIELTVGETVDPGNGTVIFDVGGSDVSVSAMPGYFTYNSSNTGVVSVGVDGVITAVGEGTADITAVLGSDKSTPATGTITVNVGSAEPVPTTPAPAPTVPSDSVISLFSDVYTDHPVDTWLAGWSVASLEDFLIGADSTKKYSNLSYAGILFESTTVDATSMTHFHMDVWTPEATAGKFFKVKLVDFGANGIYQGDPNDDVEYELWFGENTMVSEGWASIDVPLASFTGLTTKGHLAQMVISGDFGTVYVDNVYFYESGEPTEPLVPAPTPTVNPSYVASVYSDAYTPATTVDTYLAGWSSANVEDFVVSSDSSKKYTNLQWAGILMESAPLDASSMTRFHMDVWTPLPTDAPTVFRVKLVDFGADGAYGGDDDVEHELVFDENTMNTGEWVSIDVPLTDFTNLTTTGHIAQMVISTPNEPLLSTVFIDNIYFYTEPPTAPESSAPTPTQDPDSVFSVFSDAYTSVPFDVWSPEWDQGDVIDTVVGSDPIKKYTHWGETWVLSEYSVDVTGPQDISDMEYLHIDIWTPNVTDEFTQYKIKLVDFGPNGVYQGDPNDDTEHEIVLTNVELSSYNWVSLDIPMSSFTNLTTRSHFAQMVISGTYGTVFVDNIYFYK